MRNFSQLSFAKVSNRRLQFNERRYLLYFNEEMWWAWLEQDPARPRLSSYP